VTATHEALRHRSERRRTALAARAENDQLAAGRRDIRRQRLEGATAELVVLIGHTRRLGHELHRLDDLGRRILVAQARALAVGGTGGHAGREVGQQALPPLGDVLGFVDVTADHLGAKDVSKRDRHVGGLLRVRRAIDGNIDFLVHETAFLSDEPRRGEGRRLAPVAARG